MSLNASFQYKSRKSFDMKTLDNSSISDLFLLPNDRVMIVEKKQNDVKTEQSELINKAHSIFIKKQNLIIVDLFKPTTL